MKKASLAIPGVITLLNWLCCVLGYVAIQAEWVQEDAADKVQVTLLTLCPFLWLITFVASLVMWISGRRSDWITLGIFGSLLGMGLMGLVWVALFSAFSDLASFG